jgi:hypothetical protein
MRTRRLLCLAAAFALALSLLPLSAGAAEGDLTYITEDGVTKTDNVELKAHIPYIGGSEVDSDGGRWLFAGEANFDPQTFNRQNVTQGEGGLRIIDLEGEIDPETGERVGQFEVVGFLDCPGTDNYVRYMDPEVFNTPEGDREFVVMSFHGNRCITRGGAFDLRSDPNTQNSYGGQNGIMVIDVTDKANPTIVSAIGHESAHTVMPHPTRPYLYILPGGIANGVNPNRRRLAPTGIIDASDLLNLRYVRAFDHNAQGCHDLGFSHDGDYAFCAGIQEVQVWQIDGDKIENPLVTGRIFNPAIQFAHNVVVSPSGKYIAINDEAFGFHTCFENEAADLYGSLWIYDITIPDAPILAGKISPPGHPEQNNVNTMDWTQGWCAAHNYNWLPGTDDYIAASWFAGGVTVHDMSNPVQPELIAHYMPHDGSAWSGHYYSGYLVTNDIVRGTEILEVEGLRELEGDPEALQAQRAAVNVNLGATRVDLTDVLVPKVLPPRPVTFRSPLGAGPCSIPG